MYILREKRRDSVYIYIYMRGRGGENERDFAHNLYLQSVCPYHSSYASNCDVDQRDGHYGD